MKHKVTIVLSILHFFTMLYAIIQCPVETVPIHFNVVGEADNYSSKWLYLIFALLPFIIAGSFNLYLQKAPQNQNVQKNRKFEEQYVPMLALLFIVISWIFAVPVLFLKEFSLNTTLLTFIPLSLSLLFFWMAMIMPKVKYNRSFGLRVSWTLRNETVWRKTHRMMGYTASIGSLISIVLCIISLCIANPFISFFGIFFIILGGVIIPSIYAWHISKQEVSK